MAFPQPTDFRAFAMIGLTTQLVVVATPVLLMTVVLTSSPAQTLLLRRPNPLAIPAAALLAVALHPLARVAATCVEKLYPSDALQEAAKNYERIFQAAPFWQLLLIIAVAPAICEELAFRGFILSGFRHLGHKWRAIIYTALLFGVTHAILQQSLVAILLGVVVGYVAVQTGSILPGMVFHLINNGLLLATTRMPPEMLDRWPQLGAFISPSEKGGYECLWPLIAVGAVLALLLLAWFARLPCRKSAEEELQEAISRAR
jgi:sodium transport system permease protein